MAGKDDYVSVLEKGDMSSPAYRKQLEKDQALEGVYPETWGLHGLVKNAAQKGASLAKGLRNVAFPEESLVGTVTGSPRMDALAYELRGPATSTAGVDRAMGEMRTKVAARQLTPQQKTEWARTGQMPDVWPSMRENASVIGAEVGRTGAWSPPAPPSAKDLFFGAYDPVEAAALKRVKNFDLPMAVASSLRSEPRTQPQTEEPMQSESTGRSLRYRYGGK